MKVLYRRFIIHILPIKRLAEEITEKERGAAVIACSSRPLCFDERTLSEGFCTVTFADVIDPALPSSIREEHAVRIRDFVLGLGADITDLYICCDSGESRSPAIAAALLTAGGLSDDIIWKNPFYSPNILVYQRVCGAFGINIHEDLLAARKHVNEQAYKLARQRHSTLGYGRWQIIDMWIL